MSETYKTRYQSPVGSLEIEATDTAVTAIRFAEAPAEPSGSSTDALVLQTCVRQLDEYFKGQRTLFDLPLQLGGTEFQQTVWRELMTIPFGQTISYGELARRIGNPKAVRAVGLANGKNIINIVIPCHRVIGGNGKLTGYGGGLDRKAWLLAHEKTVGEPGRMGF